MKIRTASHNAIVFGALAVALACGTTEANGQGTAPIPDTGENHHPVPVLNGDTTRQVLEFSAAAGSSLALNAEGSNDPDGDGLSYNWFLYDEPSSYAGAVTIQDSNRASATAVIPGVAAGRNIFVVLEMRDDGSPNLYRYRRAIINVR
jgi:hypothetical protein